MSDTPIDRSPRLSDGYVESMTATLDNMQRQAERDGNDRALDYVKTQRAILNSAVVTAGYVKPVNSYTAQERATDRSVGLEQHPASAFNATSSETLPAATAIAVAAGLSKLGVHPTVGNVVLDELRVGTGHDPVKTAAAMGQDAYAAMVDEASKVVARLGAPVDVSKLSRRGLMLLSTHAAHLKRAGRL
jgi:hypothetical protein